MPDGRPNPAASPKQRVIGRIMSAVERVYENLLLKMGEKNSALFEQAPATFDVILTNPSFGGRDAQAKADAIDATTFDLKAVNPHAKIERDIRTPREILDAIAVHGRTVEAALKRLRALMI